ncbi:ABC transporter substrate-binding protein [Streptomyces brasiliscabiei]|uniref:ABC transporter substrate-binding protein n=1 Tax=Streptomyces brasiliscabiei TaxID=2736302 RepID=A0ABU8GQE5_9ACTN
MRVTLVDPLEAMVHGRKSAALRIGLVVPHSGVLGLTGPSALEAALLAAQEINTARGSRERPVEFVVVDSGGPRASVADTVGLLADGGAVEAYIGLHTSHTLVGVERALAGRVPYVFAAGFEENRNLPGVYCPGETPSQFAPGLSRVIADRTVTSWAILGTDYIWPQVMREVGRETITAAGAEVVLDRLLPQGGVGRLIDGVLDAVTAADAGGVLLNLPGRDLVTALRAIRGRGLDRRLVRVSGALEENTLYALGGDRSGNLYASSHSFDTSASPKRAELNDRYRLTFGDAAPVLNSWAEHCYDAVHLLAQCELRGLLSGDAFGRHVTGRPGSSAEDLLPRYATHLAVAEGIAFRVL